MIKIMNSENLSDTVISHATGTENHDHGSRERFSGSVAGETSDFANRVDDSTSIGMHGAKVETSDFSPVQRSEKFFPQAQVSVATPEPQAQQNERGPHELRLMEVLKVIPAYSGHGKGITVPQIIEGLGPGAAGLSVRTIQRVIVQLERENYIDVSQSGRSKIIQLQPGLAGLNYHRLNRRESLLLTLAFRQLETMLPQSLKASLDNLFVQAMGNVLDQPDQLDQQWLHKIYTANSTQPLIPKESREGVLENVSDALYENAYLKLDYVNKMGEARSGTVMPLALVQQGNKTLLVCRCKEWDKKERPINPDAKLPINWNLMLHRIQFAKKAEQNFNRPGDFDVQEYDRLGGFGIGNGRAVRLSFDMKREFALSLLETKLSEDQTHEDHGNWIKINATVADTFILNHWLHGFDHVEGVRNIVKTDDI